MDEVLRLPYLTEAAVREIILQVYSSTATKVTNKQLQQINMHRIQTPGRSYMLPEIGRASKQESDDESDDQPYDYSDDSDQELVDTERETKELYGGRRMKP